MPVKARSYACSYSDGLYDFCIVACICGICIYIGIGYCCGMGIIYTLDCEIANVLAEADTPGFTYMTGAWRRDICSAFGIGLLWFRPTWMSCPPIDWAKALEPPVPYIW